MVRWIVEAKGWNIFWKYHDSSKLSDLGVVSEQELEEKWLSDIAKKKFSSKPCFESVPPREQFERYCSMAALEKTKQ